LQVFLKPLAYPYPAKKEVEQAAENRNHQDWDDPGQLVGWLACIAQYPRDRRDARSDAQDSENIEIIRENPNRRSQHAQLHQQSQKEKSRSP
jgi:hypothetical protein